MKRLMMFTVACCLLPLCAGCTTEAERTFVTEDVEGLGMYIAKAQPAVEAYCDALAEQGMKAEAATLRADTRALAIELKANAEARLDKLRVEAQFVAAARTALAVADSVLTILQTRTEASHAASQPSDN